LVAVPSIGRATQVTPRRGAPEADATRDLYERYARQIHAFCLHQLGSREEAEDAVQSTFLNAFRGLKRGIDPEFESAWLYKIAENVCLTRQRSSYRRRRVESPGDLDAMQDLLPAHEADADELIRLPEALEEMPEQQRHALLLREWQGLSYREIAGQLGLSQSAVETLLFRARRSLANALTDDSKPKSAGLRRLRTGGDAGSLVALVKTLVFSGGAKVAVTVVTVAATSAVASSPAVRHSAEVMFASSHAPHAKPVTLARHVHGSFLFHASSRVALAATRPRPLSGKLIAAASRAAYTARLGHAHDSVEGLGAALTAGTSGLPLVSRASVAVPPSPRRAVDEPVVVAPPAPVPPVVDAPTPVATDAAAVPVTSPAGDAGSGSLPPTLPATAPASLNGPQSTTPVVVATPLTVPDAKTAKAAGKDARNTAKADDKAAKGHGKNGDALVATTPAPPAPTPALPPAAVAPMPAPADAQPAALPAATPAPALPAAPPVTTPPVTEPDAGNSDHGDKGDHGLRNGYRK
jgi:RNA polymerase sigma factor (sigma-70 family)